MCVSKKQKVDILESTSEMEGQIYSENVEEEYAKAIDPLTFVTSNNQLTLPAYQF